jgi:hypothetical protein
VLESAAYFFDAIDRLGNASYDPSVEDILRARQKTTGSYLSLLVLAQLRPLAHPLLLRHYRSQI